MSSTNNLELPYIVSGQAQKHVTHNDAIRLLDAVVQLSVISTTINDPPVTPAEGDRYIVGADPTGGWVGKEKQLAAFVDDAWMFLMPQTGWIAWVQNDQTLHVCEYGDDHQINWNSLQGSSAASNEVNKLGINTIADETNRLAIKSDASLFSFETDDHRLIINKNTAQDTASMLFQSNFLGVTELGLTGGQDFQINVSQNGLNWSTAITVKRDSGDVEIGNLSSGKVLIAADEAVSIPTPKAGGIIVIMLSGGNYPHVNHSGIFAYDVGPSLSLLKIAGGPEMQNLGTQILSGTTGSDDETGIAVKSNYIQIENRINGTAEYSYLFIG